MHSFNFRELIKRVPVKAPAKAVFESWSTQAGLESWFLRKAEFTRPDGSLRSRTEPVQAGDKYKWLWYGYEDDTIESNEIIETNGWDRLRFSFSGSCNVEVTIKQEEGEVICELKQHMPMDDIKQQQYYFIECGKGWTFYLANLKSILEGGIDLRNRNSSLKDVINS